MNINFLIFLLHFSIGYGYSYLSGGFLRFIQARKYHLTSLEMGTISSSDATSKKLPVTILSGFLGAGKTTLLNHILQSEHDTTKYAVIVNDMSELNIDEQLVKDNVRYQEEKLVEMSNGCICCTLREDLLREVAALAKQNKFDHLIIESTGIAEPLPIAETFTFKTENGTECLLDVAEIDNMITVVDAVNFVQDLKLAEDLMSRGIAADENDTRTITDLLISQIEFASIIIINKCDLVSKERLQKVRQNIKALNSEARVIETIRSNINIDEVIGSHSFNFEKVSESAAWLQAINNPEEKIPETEEYGISSLVYRARKPFHPTRLMQFIEEELEFNTDEEEEGNVESTTSSRDSTQQPLILRSKGFFWLASRPDQVLIWSQAGGLFQITPGGYWWADIPLDQWPDESPDASEADMEDRSQIERDWREPFGDRRQELVFIGTNMNKEYLEVSLNSCLLTEEEMSVVTEAVPTQGEDIFDAWRELDDPFPQIEDADEEDGDDYDDDSSSEDSESFTMLS